MVALDTSMPEPFRFFIEKQYVLLVFAGVWAPFHGVGDQIKAFQIRRLRELYDTQPR